VCICCHLKRFDGAPDAWVDLESNICVYSSGLGEWGGGGHRVMDLLNILCFRGC